MPLFVSHPTWVRGLKLFSTKNKVFPIFVAPYMGAWIETCLEAQQSRQEPVAPYMGAWIETWC